MANDFISTAEHNIEKTGTKVSDFKSSVGKFFDILEIIDIKENDDNVDDEVEKPETFKLLRLVFICGKCPFGQPLSLFYF